MNVALAVTNRLLLRVRGLQTSNNRNWCWLIGLNESSTDWRLQTASYSVFEV